MYPLLLHKTLTVEKWAAYPVDRQILMIANELNRLKNGVTKSQSVLDLRGCMERAFELIDLTINSHRGSLQRELLYFRELFSELYLLNEVALSKELPKIEALYKALLLLNGKSAALAFL